MERKPEPPEVFVLIDRGGNPVGVSRGFVDFSEDPRGYRSVRYALPEDETQTEAIVTAATALRDAGTPDAALVRLDALDEAIRARDIARHERRTGIKIVVDPSCPKDEVRLYDSKTGRSAVVKLRSAP
jgi:hypothetical protein